MICFCWFISLGFRLSSKLLSSSSTNWFKIAYNNGLENFLTIKLYFFKFAHKIRESFFSNNISIGIFDTIENFQEVMGTWGQLFKIANNYSQSLLKKKLISVTFTNLVKVSISLVSFADWIDMFKLADFINIQII